MAVLRAAGAPIERPGDAPRALRDRRSEIAERLLEPAAVAWDGAGSIRLRLPAALAERRAQVHLTLEEGETRAWTADLSTTPGTRDSGAGAPHPLVLKDLALPSRLPVGYHRVDVKVGRRRASSVLISAPLRAPGDERRGEWGVFVPLYALRTARDWGVGDVTDLAALMEWVGSLGGDAVATLPLQAAFLDEPFEPTPYSPASRLFWNELYADVTRVPELERSSEARERIGALEPEIAALRRRRFVDYRRAMAVKRGVLEAMAGQAFSGPSRRRRDLMAFAESRHALADYARFRAACQRYGGGWSTWPARQRDGDLRDDDVDRDVVRYHLYCQFVMEEQLGSLAAAARTGGPDLYLDLPLGVNPAGYEVWRDRALFALGAATGSPPDDFSPGGQDWGFPPPRSERLRAQGYRYLRECYATVFRYAGVLRIDHVMALHRLFWVPRGMDPTEGVYVRYRPEEMYAVLLVEAHRRGALVVGEDLGTVPRAVRRAMDRHGVRRSYVAQTEARPRRGAALPPPPPGAVASLNTHDMPTFAAFWTGSDIDERADLGRLDRRDATRERDRRRRLRAALVAFLRREGRLAPRAEADAGEVLRACLEHLGQGPAGMVLPTLEDLWLEPRAQNLPADPEYPSWRRRARYALERMRSMRGPVGTLTSLDRTRRGSEPT